jgi:cyclohexyl-isocyanide hydratase
MTFRGLLLRKSILIPFFSNFLNWDEYITNFFQDLPMKISFLTYSEATQLDITGPLEVLSRGPDAECCLIAEHPGLISLGLLTVDVEYGLEELATSDVLVVPGGPGVVEAMRGREVCDAVKQFHETGKPILSVCTGALLLGSCGILEGKRVATHWASSEFIATYKATYVAERVCIDDTLITSAGVSAGIDAAFVLSERLWGRDVVEEIVVQMQYRPSVSFELSDKKTEIIRDRLRSGRLKQLLNNRQELISGIEKGK